MSIQVKAFNKKLTDVQCFCYIANRELQRNWEFFLYKTTTYCPTRSGAVWLYNERGRPLKANIKKLKKVKELKINV